MDGYLFVPEHSLLQAQGHPTDLFGWTICSEGVNPGADTGRGGGGVFYFTISFSLKH